MRCVVLTGTGRAFCTGQDLKEHIEILESQSSEVLFDTVEEHYNPIVTALAGMEKPVVAAVNGVAAGAGASLAFACDLRIVADTAGLQPRLRERRAVLRHRLVASRCSGWSAGPRRWSCSTSRAPSRPRRRWTLGLATQVVPADELDAVVAELAARLAAGPTVALGCDAALGGVRRRAHLRGGAAARERR